MVMLDETLRPRLAEAGVRAQVESELGALLAEVNATLAGHEQLQFIVVAGEPWTMANGCLTPTMKIKRSRIEGRRRRGGGGLVRGAGAGGLGPASGNR
jgi:long-chain acyl-CoA synthetase